jgi:hypothetical protein
MASHIPQVEYDAAEIEWSDGYQAFWNQYEDAEDDRKVRNVHLRDNDVDESNMRDRFQYWTDRKLAVQDASAELDAYDEGIELHEQAEGIREWIADLDGE